MRPDPRMKGKINDAQRLIFSCATKRMGIGCSNQHEVSAPDRNSTTIDPMNALTFLDPEELMKIVIVFVPRLSIANIMMHIGAKMIGRKMGERQSRHHLNVIKCQKRTRS